ncbi:MULTISPECIES: hypothetical protein [unclassified Corallococcus]|uniref:hypothetical protein n=1 Tax=unclassified Corallococcus TaxID=2685029 RepID=UPI001A8F8443|nr:MULTISPECIES: hypothetical protein [unclassified Corallococcus]MBN9687615.1 hypothetical protein [Corallococcus sp. NCSPR001]WAS88567.1 hypothetical protein O0N60_16640 [Corallococcus sp. NCRR]
MTSSFSLRRAVLLAALSAAGCAGSSMQTRADPSPPLPPPPTSVALTVGYEEAVRLGAAFARNQGPALELVMAKQGESSWWLRYASPEGHALLDLRVDGQTAKVEPIPLPPSAGAPSR